MTLINSEYILLVRHNRIQNGVEMRLRYHPDGVLELSGKNKQFAKIRGFRVELSIVESALRE